MKLTTDIFSEFDQVWALVTAGTPDNFNTMTRKMRRMICILRR